ncbi:MAG TPA: cbb3-type cytochrome c oxidase N-terminal domain-containing protein [Myxococcota bacterium]
MNEGHDDVGAVHVYDGIVEHDNRLPRWWLVTLWATVVFAVGYWGYFHTLGAGVLPGAALAAQLQEKVVEEEKAVAAAPVLDDAALLAMTKDAAVVERGRAVYAASCVACHADKGQGLVGPNLTDDVWVHDNAPLALVQLIGEGVLTKGMPAWKPALGAEKVKDVAVFVLTLKGTHVAGKAPEGTIPTK